MSYKIKNDLARVAQMKNETVQMILMLGRLLDSLNQLQTKLVEKSEQLTPEDESDLWAFGF